MKSRLDWSQLATNVVVSKYFYGEINTPERESSVRQLVHRVTRTIADWGKEDGYFETEDDGERFYRDLTWLVSCISMARSTRRFGLTWDCFTNTAFLRTNATGTGIPRPMTVVQPENPYTYPQASACFIQSVGDNMEDIMSLATSEAMLFKFGSGTGTDLVDDSLAA